MKLVCILNYNKNDNADYLYKEFSKYCKTYVIDSNSDNPYSYFENVGNFYYTNLFNHAIKKFKDGNYDYLLIITSDIEISKEAIKYVCNIETDSGIWSLQTDKDSRDFYNPYKENLPKIRETKCIEGFFNLMSKDVALSHKEIPLKINKYGVCIDKYSAYITKKLNKLLIIDSTYLIHHPKEKGYDAEKSHSYDRIFKRWYKK